MPTNDHDSQGYERAHRALTEFYSGAWLDPKARRIAGPDGVSRPLAETATRVAKAKKAAEEGKIALFDANGQLLGYCDPDAIEPLATGVSKALGRRPSAVTRSDIFAALGRLHSSTRVRKSRRPADRKRQVAAGVAAYGRLSGTDRVAIDRLLRQAAR
ncbi:hypothetical protein K6U06_19780 [Acidiferrimicrobium sp. IK]|uniref:hypothetical protein n=1 Tax=Acidiferrimicrobium sp. IK TaxID=2871700 RepID=UPI0021CAEA63|nr:hypothetical protein [Acidiferrimicrobium sp. IK]MCU4186615.1 hypothetical protein [Acidiferrimicrobium sp. IK]